MVEQPKHSLESRCKSGQSFRHYESSRKFDVIEKMAVNAAVFWSSLTNRSYPLTMAYRAYCPNDWAKIFVRVTWFHRALVLSVGESRLSFLLIAHVSLDFARFNGKAIGIRIRRCDNLIIGSSCSTVTLTSNFAVHTL